MESKMSQVEKKRTIFVDIDGTILEHRDKNNISINQPLLPGVKEKFEEWKKRGDKIILTTARNRILRRVTEETLMGYGLQYDDLLMELGSGERIIINDEKPYDGWEGRETGIGVTVKRNEGLKNVAY